MQGIGVEMGVECVGPNFQQGHLTPTAVYSQTPSPSE